MGRKVPLRVERVRGLRCLRRGCEAAYFGAEVRELVLSPYRRVGSAMCLDNGRLHFVSRVHCALAWDVDNDVHSECAAGIRPRCGTSTDRYANRSTDTSAAGERSAGYRICDRVGSTRRAHASVAARGARCPQIQSREAARCEALGQTCIIDCTCTVRTRYRVPLWNSGGASFQTDISASVFRTQKKTNSRKGTYVRK